MRIGVAISGGMDSAASALLLKNQGHDIVALHMKLFHESESSIVKAQRVAALVKKPLHIIDMVSEFKTIVLDYFVQEYSLGRTPSPCPRCNRFVKLDILAKHARAMGCEQIATGHYANIVAEDGFPTLTKACDTLKDQSYFLFMVTPEILNHTIFPLGSWKKTQVRKFLQDIDPNLSQSKESQELCFIDDNDYVSFLERMGVNSTPGPIKDSDGNVLGQHKGIINYTVGQRRGLGVCGPYPRYVLRIDHQTNSVIIGVKAQTLATKAVITNLNFIRHDLAVSNAFFQVKIRSTSRPVNCWVTKIEDDKLEFEFTEPQSSVAPGQAAVFYAEHRVVMGGWIDTAI